MIFYHVIMLIFISCSDVKGQGQKQGQKSSLKFIGRSRPHNRRSRSKGDKACLGVSDSAHRYKVTCQHCH